ncbi:MAG TPA: hypothetical protein VJ438_06140, partial [Candidatus Nanoarchaeia archaeon]|nr:hypothetical protein [Candidatus Nanoarchaeia archaeon]
TIPVVNARCTDDFRVIGTIKNRERKGNSLIFTLEKISIEEGKEKIIEKTVRIDYNGISLDEMFKQEGTSNVTETGWRHMLKKNFSFPGIKI